MSANQPSEVRNNARVLLIIVPEGKKERLFFTPKKNAPYLTEFARTFGAKMLDVRVKQAEVLQLRALTEAFCDKTLEYTAEYEVIKDITPPTATRPTPPKKKVKKKKKTSDAQQIQAKIMRMMVKGGTVETAKLYKQLAKHELSESTIRRHFKTVRVNLEEDGYDVEKLSPGKYQLNL